MKQKLLGIAAGLSAAATSFTQATTEPEENYNYRVGARRIICPVCGGDEFDQKSMLINTPGMTLMNLDWLNASACVLVCRQCTRMELFAEAPENG